MRDGRDAEGIMATGAPPICTAVVEPAHHGTPEATVGAARPQEPEGGGFDGPWGRPSHATPGLFARSKRWSALGPRRGSTRRRPYKPSTGNISGGHVQHSCGATSRSTHDPAGCATCGTSGSSVRHAGRWSIPARCPRRTASVPRDRSAHEQVFVWTAARPTPATRRTRRATRPRSPRSRRKRS